MLFPNVVPIRPVRNGNQDPDPLSPGAWLAIAAVLCAIFAVAGYFMISSAMKADAKHLAAVKQYERAWDQGVGHPQATELHPGDTVTVAPTVRSLDEAVVYSCFIKDCQETAPGPYPIIYPGNQQNWGTDGYGCVTIGPFPRLANLMVAATLDTTDTYRVHLWSDGKNFTICTDPNAVGLLDKLIIWTTTPGIAPTH